MHIGWASTDITPERLVNLRGQHHARISTRVNDPLLVTALAISAGNQQMVMVSCDRVGIPDAILQRVREALEGRAPGLDPRNVFLNATHTHTAPEIQDGIYPPLGPEVMTAEEYADLFVTRVADCIARAWEARASGGVSWGFGHAVIGHNRRAAYFDGTSRMYGATNVPEFAHIEGYEDHSLDLLFTWDEQRRLTGLVVNLACPSQVTEGEYYVSADFWHEVRQDLAKRLGAEVFVLPQCSAAGDQSPHFLLYARAEEMMRQRRGLSEREEIARRIGLAVEDVLAYSRDEIHTDVPFRHETRLLNLPARKVTAAEYEVAQQRFKEFSAQQPDPADLAAVSFRFVMLRRNEAVMRRYEKQGEQPVYPVEVHLARLGDVAFATNPFELFLDFGLRIKARCQALQTFIIQLAGNGTYLPTARALAATGYGAEAADNRVGPEGGQVLVEETVAGLNAMWEND